MAFALAAVPAGTSPPPMSMSMPMAARVVTLVARRSPRDSAPPTSFAFGDGKDVRGRRWQHRERPRFPTAGSFVLSSTARATKLAGDRLKFVAGPGLASGIALYLSGGRRDRQERVRDLRTLQKWSGFSGSKFASAHRDLHRSPKKFSGLQRHRLRARRAPVRRGGRRSADSAWQRPRSREHDARDLYDILSLSRQPARASRCSPRACVSRGSSRSVPSSKPFPFVSDLGQDKGSQEPAGRDFLLRCPSGRRLRLPDVQPHGGGRVQEIRQAVSGRSSASHRHHGPRVHRQDAVRVVVHWELTGNGKGEIVLDARSDRRSRSSPVRHRV